LVKTKELGHDIVDLKAKLNLYFLESQLLASFNPCTRHPPASRLKKARMLPPVGDIETIFRLLLIFGN
jgi:hypothetical protein